MTTRRFRSEQGKNDYLAAYLKAGLEHLYVYELDLRSQEIVKKAALQLIADSEASWSRYFENREDKLRDAPQDSYDHPDPAVRAIERDRYEAELDCVRHQVDVLADESRLTGIAIIEETEGSELIDLAVQLKARADAMFNLVVHVAWLQDAILSLTPKSEQR